LHKKPEKQEIPQKYDTIGDIKNNLPGWVRPEMQPHCDKRKDKKRFYLLVLILTRLMVSSQYFGERTMDSLRKGQDF
jgi:hypothetical protein